MKWVKISIGAVIAISVIPMIITSVSDLTTPGDATATPPIPAGALNGTIAGTLLDLAPLIFVAGVLTFLFLSTRNKND